MRSSVTTKGGLVGAGCVHGEATAGAEVGVLRDSSTTLCPSSSCALRLEIEVPAGAPSDDDDDDGAAVGWLPSQPTTRSWTSVARSPSRGIPTPLTKKLRWLRCRLSPWVRLRFPWSVAASGYVQRGLCDQRAHVRVSQTSPFAVVRRSLKVVWRVVRNRTQTVFLTEWTVVCASSASRVRLPSLSSSEVRVTTAAENVSPTTWRDNFRTTLPARRAHNLVLLYPHSPSPDNLVTR
jgi:hypothetical protein